MIYLSFKLFDNADNEVKELLLMDKENDPHERFTDKQFTTLYPSKTSVSYNAQIQSRIVSYRVKNKRCQSSFMGIYHTRNLQIELHTIETKDATVHLSKGKSHILLTSCHKMLH